MQDTVTPFVPPTVISFSILTAILIFFGVAMTVARQLIWRGVKFLAKSVIYEGFRKLWTLLVRRRRRRSNSDPEHGLVDQESSELEGVH